MARTERQRLGQIGEDATVMFLKKHGFTISDRNYLKKWGEIDIVAKKGERVHFIEVKSGRVRSGVLDEYEIEDHMHDEKIRRLERAIYSYIGEKFRNEEPEWQLDLVVVEVDEKNKKAKIRYIPEVG